MKKIEVPIEKIVYRDRIVERPVEVIRIQEVIKQIEVPVEKIVY